MTEGPERAPWRMSPGQGQPGILLYCPDHPDDIRFFKTSGNKAPPCPTCGRRLARLHPKGQTR